MKQLNHPIAFLDRPVSVTAIICNYIIVQITFHCAHMYMYMYNYMYIYYVHVYIVSTVITLALASY